MTQPAVLILPGLGNSGPEHWQSWLQDRLPALSRVQFGNWDAPALEDWSSRLDEAVRAAPGQVVLVAHSLACILVAHWAATATDATTGKVAAALLVAPPDVESPDHTPPEVHGFAPVPTAPLPFPALVVGSRNDPYCPAARACAFAALWGADFIDAGDAGHINPASGHGPWPMGEALVKELAASL
ncbi:RBBP9/YdeN family alpha/beta hydrolase [Azospirillum picis]|uniref:Alpha/beta hydrolase family esterase n=1 Tax=Azospirillum picis TaxID=488438 RepID=A0ABU0MPM2_9PROT|nr:alpha/beta hydrolase [Azospirillum picis]MBP2301353.1 putative alpha/beta hydrolase family esterase [Azospirillum picis]MDQ0535184.1 putative alpha/beta hydrolase family esterase [Azospirillum picis]